MMYGYNGYGYGWGGGGLMMIGMAIFWVIIIVLAVIFIRRFAGHGGFHHPGHYGHHGYHHDDAMEILRQRYAKGEINEEEFNKMKEMLKS